MSCFCINILGDCVVARKMKRYCALSDPLDFEGFCQDVVRPKRS